MYREGGSCFSRKEGRGWRERGGEAEDEAVVEEEERYGHGKAFHRTTSGTAKEAKLACTIFLKGTLSTSAFCVASSASPSSIKRARSFVTNSG
jgi:hypothetical protein